MTQTALQILANNLKTIKNSRQKYETTVQDSIEVFLNNYEGALSRNSKPLQDLLGAVAPKDVQIIKWYLAKCSNIKALKSNDKGNLQIVTIDNRPLQVNDYIIEHCWYDLKVSVKVTEDFKDLKTMLSSFNSFLNKAIKSKEKLQLTDKTIADLSTLKTQLESYK